MGASASVWIVKLVASITVVCQFSICCILSMCEDTCVPSCLYLHVAIASAYGILVEQTVWPMFMYVCEMHCSNIGKASLRLQVCVLVLQESMYHKCFECLFVLP